MYKSTMAKPKRQVSFFVETDLWKQFSKKCIDKDKSKSEVLVEFMNEFVEKN